MNEDLSFGMAAFAQLAQKAEPKLAAELSRRGVASPRELPVDVAQQIFKDALLATAAEYFPDARIDALAHGLTSFFHPKFGQAFTHLKATLDKPADAFAFATGLEAAVVLAAFGLPVAPFDRKQPRMLAELSNDIDDVVKSFSRYKSALVGYSPCDIPFYILLTDCVSTMKSQIANRSQLEEVKQVLERTGVELPKGPLRDFTHGLALIPREPGDSVSTVFLDNPNPKEGSVVFYAGWAVNNVRHGAPNSGFLPVPNQFLEAALKNPEIAMWLWKPVGIRVLMN